MRRAGVSVVGGHSVRDPELKFGYAVTGLARRKSLLLNSGARPGDAIFLTKPLGTGILSTALKQGRLDAALTRRLTEHMAALNRAASEAAVHAGARAATDVTGFGLLGHASQLADASGVTLELRPAKTWFLPRVLELAAAGVVPGGLARNREHYSPSIAMGLLERAGPPPRATARAADGPRAIEPALLDALHDPQTSGGLLVCVPERRAAAFVSALRRRKGTCLDVGRVRPRGASSVVLAVA